MVEELMRRRRKEREREKCGGGIRFFCLLLALLGLCVCVKLMDDEWTVCLW